MKSGNEGAHSELTVALLFKEKRHEKVTECQLMTWNQSNAAALVWYLGPWNSSSVFMCVHVWVCVCEGVCLHSFFSSIWVWFGHLLFHACIVAHNCVLLPLCGFVYVDKVYFGEKRTSLCFFFHLSEILMWIMHFHRLSRLHHRQLDDSQVSKEVNGHAACLMFCLTLKVMSCTLAYWLLIWHSVWVNSYWLMRRRGEPRTRVEALRSWGSGPLMTDVICSCLSACEPDCAVLEVSVGSDGKSCGLAVLIAVKPTRRGWILVIETRERENEREKERGRYVLAYLLKKVVTVVQSHFSFGTKIRFTLRA